MSGMLMIAALQIAQGAAATSPSQPSRLLNPETVITYQDHPTDSLRRNEHGIVSVLLHVSPDGRATSCDVTERSGSAALDKKTCSLLKSRARFEPAKDVTGAPIAGEYRSANSWGVDEHQPRTTIELSLLVPAIPRDYRSPIKARLVFDATGHVAECEITATSGSGAADREACAYARQQLVTNPPETMSSDTPPTAVRYLTASLSTQAAEPSNN